MSELDFKESIFEKGYAPVNIDLANKDLELAMASYLGFLSLDDKLHQLTRYDLANRGDSDFGQYTRISGAKYNRGEVADNKDIFHFGAQTRQIIEARLNGAMPEEMKTFLDSAEAVFWAAQRAKREALCQLDTLEAGLVEITLPERVDINDVLRFIAYYPNEGALAKGHFDRSMATLTVWESHEGLRIAPGQNGWFLDLDGQGMANIEAKLKPVFYNEGEAKFMLGAGWNRLPSNYRFGNNYLPLGWHDVVESDKKVNDRVMREAVVMFINPHLGLETYSVPSPPETRPYKQLGRLAQMAFAA